MSVWLLMNQSLSDYEVAKCILILAKKLDDHKQLERLLNLIKDSELSAEILPQILTNVHRFK